MIGNLQGQVRVPRKQPFLDCFNTDEDNDEIINNTNITLDQPPATPIPEDPDIVDDNATMEEANAPTLHLLQHSKQTQVTVLYILLIVFFVQVHACYHQVLLFQVPPNEGGI